MNNKLKSLYIMFFAILTFCSHKTVLCQVANINIGNFQLEWHDNAQFTGGYGGGSFSGVWPNGWFRRGTIGWYGVGEGYEQLVKFRNGVDATGGLDTLKREFEYAPEVDGPVTALKELRRYNPPSVIVDGKPDKPFKGEVNSSLAAPQVVETISKTGWGRGGCWFKIKVYAFDNPNFDDFVILDYTMVEKDNFTKENNNPNGPTNQIIRNWFSPIFAFEPTQYGYEQYGQYWGVTDTWTDYVVRQSQLVTPGSTTRDSLIISYACDSNDPRISSGDNFGDPAADGSLVSPQYVGFSLLYADKSPSQHIDDISQPLNVVATNINDLWTWEPEGLLYDWATKRYRENNTLGTPWNVNPDVQNNQLSKMSFQWIGPYDMAYQDSIRFVFALGAGGINPSYAIELGKQWKQGLFSDTQKDSIVATGLDSLFTTLDKAKWAWNNYLKTGDFGIPWTLPAPDLEVTSGPGWNILSWGYPSSNMFNNPKTGLDDFKEWRVYQKRGDYLVNHPNDKAFYDYHLIYSTTDRNVTQFNDTAVVRGESYHYYVTAVTKEGVEGSRFANRTLYAASPFKAGLQSTDRVKIVPNPYMANAGALNFSDPNQIKFFNLPPYCTLRIYNEVGDIIKTIKHTSGSGDETWDQLTSANQYVASGVYILSVQDARDINGNSLDGKNYKFVIVR